MEIDGKTVEVEAALSFSLPRLGTDVAELPQLLNQPATSTMADADCLMVTTRAQSRRMEVASQYEEPLGIQDRMDDSLEAVGGEIDADLFGKSHERAPQSCQQNRASQQQFARQQILGGLELNLSIEKLRDYQQKDDSLATVRNLVSKRQ